MQTAGWMATLIQRAKTRGLNNAEIAAALEDSIVFRPVTLGRDDRERVVGTMAGDDITLDELFEPTRRTR
jgi:hypothetical protein